MKKAVIEQTKKNCFPGFIDRFTILNLIFFPIPVARALSQLDVNISLFCFILYVSLEWPTFSNVFKSTLRD